MYSVGSIGTDPPSGEAFTVCSSNGFVELDPLTDICMIDSETVKTLELIQNNVDQSNRKHSLFGLLNAHTNTTTGTRMLKNSILKPFCNYEVIEHRLDCIDYLVSRVDTLSSITNCIRKYGVNIDLDHVVPCLVSLCKTRHTTLQVTEKRLDALTTLETILSQVEPLVAALELADQPVLNFYKIALMDPAYGEISTEIANIVESNVKTRNGKRGKVFRIKHGVEAVFDIARNTYQIAMSDMETYVKDLQREDGLPWKLNFTEGKGFYLILPANQMPKGFTLSDKYKSISKTRTAITCTTVELMKSNVRARISYENSMALANEILTTCLNNIVAQVGSLNRLRDVVGQLDLVTCLAKVANNTGYGRMVRPVFTATDTIVESSRHPVLEGILGVHNIQIVPNDIKLSTGRQNFMLVTGPNMGGKSVFLKQVGIIQIMAQLGSYVPAEQAHLKVMNRIVARSGTNDDNLSSCSSFMWEMKGIASALRREENFPDQATLFLIDEVGRGTSIDDGASYSFAIAEELALRRNCFTVFATHFDQVFSLANLYNSVTAYHFDYEDEPGDAGDQTSAKLTHTLVPGMGKKSHYGIRLAELCNLPEEIIRLAKEDAGLSI